MSFTFSWPCCSSIDSQESLQLLNIFLDALQVLAGEYSENSITVLLSRGDAHAVGVCLVETRKRLLRFRSSLE